MFLGAAPDYGLSIDPFKLPDSITQTGRGALSSYAKKPVVSSKKTKAKTGTTDAPVISTSAPVVAEQKPFDIKEWVNGSVFIAGKTIPRKVLIGVAVSGVLWIALAGMGKKTVLAVAGKS